MSETTYTPSPRTESMDSSLNRWWMERFEAPIPDDVLKWLHDLCRQEVSHARLSERLLDAASLQQLHEGRRLCQTKLAHIEESRTEVKRQLERLHQFLKVSTELKKQAFDSPMEMAQELLAGNLDAVVCNKAYVDLLDDAIGDYSKLTRIIYEKDFETKIEEESAEASGSGDGSGSDQKSTRLGARQPGEKLTEHPFNILISGIDVSGPISTTSRSDVNIIMTVNPLSHRILLTTTPRDYFVLIPGISGEERDKLTHAGVYGVRTSMRTLEDLYDIGISDYIRINFDSLIQLVDALGGIDVNSEVAFSSGDYYFNEGINHMNGEQALVYCRSRYQFGSGDNQRGKNQMQVLTAIIDKLQSPELLKNPTEVLDVVGRSMQTSFTSDEIAEVIRERFGREADIWRSTQESFYIKVPISVSPAFYGWVFRFGGMIRIVSPATVREAYLRKASDIIKTSRSKL